MVRLDKKRKKEEEGKNQFGSFSQLCETGVSIYTFDINYARAHGLVNSIIYTMKYVLLFSFLLGRDGVAVQ